MIQPGTNSRLQGWKASADATLIGTSDLPLGANARRLHRLGDYLVAFTERGLELFGVSSGITAATEILPQIPCTPVLEEQIQPGADGSLWLPAGEFPVQRH